MTSLPRSMEASSSIHIGLDVQLAWEILAKLLRSTMIETRMWQSSCARFLWRQNKKFPDFLEEYKPDKLTWDSDNSDEADVAEKLWRRCLVIFRTRSQLWRWLGISC